MGILPPDISIKPITNNAKPTSTILYCLGPYVTEEAVLSELVLIFEAEIPADFFTVMVSVVFFDFDSPI